MKSLLAVVCLAGALALPSQATVITFEGFAPPGNGAAVFPTYTESGYTLTSTNTQSGIFDAAHPQDLPGDVTSWYGFGETNSIILTGPAEFNLESLVVGGTTIGAGTINFTIVGFLSGGGTVTTTFNGLTGATLQLVGFNNLTSAVFTSTDDAGFDDITVSEAPEPASMVLLGAGLGAILLRKRSRKAPAAV